MKENLKILPGAWAAERSGERQDVLAFTKEARLEEGDQLAQPLQGDGDGDGEKRAKSRTLEAELTQPPDEHFVGNEWEVPY